MTTIIRNVGFQKRLRSGITKKIKSAKRAKKSKKCKHIRRVSKRVPRIKPFCMRKLGAKLIYYNIKTGFALRIFDRTKIAELDKKPRKLPKLHAPRWALKRLPHHRKMIVPYTWPVEKIDRFNCLYKSDFVTVFLDHKIKTQRVMWKNAHPINANEKPKQSKIGPAQVEVIKNVLHTDSVDQLPKIVKEAVIATVASVAAKPTVQRDVLREVDEFLEDEQL